MNENQKKLKNVIKEFNNVCPAEFILRNTNMKFERFMYMYDFWIDKSRWLNLYSLNSRWPPPFRVILEFSKEIMANKHFYIAFFQWMTSRKVNINQRSSWL